MPLKGAVGVPVILHPPATSGLGSPVIVQAYGGVPPVAVTTAFIGDPTVPVSDVVAMTSADGLMVRLTVPEA